jgi:hypothetical protein
VSLLRSSATALTLAVASAIGGFWYGWSERSETTEIELARQVAQSRNTEARLTEYIVELDAAKNLESKRRAEANDRYHAALRERAVRVSVPVTRVLPADPAASGVAAETRAELDPAAAVRIDRVANDGDDAIRDLNQCIDLYNGVRARVNQQGQ